MRRYLFYLVLAASNPLVRSMAIPAELKPRDGNAMIADRTCRWSNCGEPCSSGFVSVPRSGGKQGEMMWDHTHCLGRGLSTFCCPANAPQPTCTWRGHANSGKCKAGCRGGEAEVWTINMGCKSGHQSACCTTTTTCMEAYDNCRWEGEAPNCWSGSYYHPLHTCSALYPHTAIESPAGFGGTDSCTHGTSKLDILPAYP